MVRRQSKDYALLRRFRLLNPGEIDDQIAEDKLVLPPSPVWDAATLSACALLYERYVVPAGGKTIPDIEFRDLPRWMFLEYLTSYHEILLVGANDDDQSQLEPIVLARNVKGWNVPRLYAFSDTLFPLFQAILDRRRLHELDCPVTTTVVQKMKPKESKEREAYYFGIDYRALPYAPWRRGTVYLYARADLPPDFQNTPYLTSPMGHPVAPVAKVAVDPWDWPLLGQVHGVDVIAQSERQHDTFDGYPWPDDTAIHPTRGKRILMEQVCAYLDTHYAENIGLTELGKYIGVSPFTLLRMFRAARGLSPREYQMLQRVTQAKRLLREGLPIAQAAIETGFYDQTHLTRHFQRVVGVTPGRYLRMQ
jgi:AraC-like DNA-binding protein